MQLICMYINNIHFLYFHCLFFLGHSFSVKILYLKMNMRRQSAAVQGAGGDKVHQVSEQGHTVQELNTFAFMEQNAIHVSMILLPCQTTFYLYKWK